jgi:hypothetical protein
MLHSRLLFSHRKATIWALRRLLNETAPANEVQVRTQHRMHVSLHFADSRNLGGACGATLQSATISQAPQRLCLAHPRLALQRAAVLQSATIS